MWPPMLCMFGEREKKRVCVCVVCVCVYRERALTLSQFRGALF